MIQYDIFCISKENYNVANIKAKTQLISVKQFSSRGVLENVSCFFLTLVKFNIDYSATVRSAGLPSVPG
ncbi:hypothetical protein T4D_102 [Trichinella pseudospiralis]|uniref:Uncharacterized protein n=1 Tax=Trichinella pseudospiralis TaxID=6337 RepID=A0A0V1FZH1_TRIPS|nr:hypothetical protein T4D_102 [Trichinella pseudospiralis]